MNLSLTYLPILSLLESFPSLNPHILSRNPDPFLLLPFFLFYWEKVLRFSLFSPTFQSSVVCLQFPLAHQNVFGKGHTGPPRCQACGWEVETVLLGIFRILNPQSFFILTTSWLTWLSDCTLSISLTLLSQVPCHTLSWPLFWPLTPSQWSYWLHLHEAWSWWWGMGSSSMNWIRQLAGNPWGLVAIPGHIISLPAGFVLSLQVDRKKSGRGSD